MNIITVYTHVLYHHTVQNVRTRQMGLQSIQQSTNYLPYLGSWWSFTVCTPVLFHSTHGNWCTTDKTVYYWPINFFLLLKFQTVIINTTRQKNITSEFQHAGHNKQCESVLYCTSIVSWWGTSLFKQSMSFWNGLIYIFACPQISFKRLDVCGGLITWKPPPLWKSKSSYPPAPSILLISFDDLLMAICSTFI